MHPNVKSLIQWTLIQARNEMIMKTDLDPRQIRDLFKSMTEQHSMFWQMADMASDAILEENHETKELF